MGLQYGRCRPLTDTGKRPTRLRAYSRFKNGWLMALRPHSSLKRKTPGEFADSMAGLY